MKLFSCLRLNITFFRNSSQCLFYFYFFYDLAFDCCVQTHLACFEAKGRLVLLCFLTHHVSRPIRGMRSELRCENSRPCWNRPALYAKLQSPSRPGLDKWECVCGEEGWVERTCVLGISLCMSAGLDYYYFCLKQPIKQMLITATNGTCQSLALVLLPCLNNSAHQHNEPILLLSFQHDCCPSQPSLLSFLSFHERL